jgi:hypothetical protein
MQAHVLGLVHDTHTAATETFDDAVMRDCALRCVHRLGGIHGVDECGLYPAVPRGRGVKTPVDRSGRTTVNRDDKEAGPSETTRRGFDVELASGSIVREADFGLVPRQYHVQTKFG